MFARPLNTYNGPAIDGSTSQEASEEFFSPFNRVVPATITPLNGYLIVSALSFTQLHTHCVSFSPSGHLTPLFLSFSFFFPSLAKRIHYTRASCFLVMAKARLVQPVCLFSSRSHLSLQLQSTDSHPQVDHKAVPIFEFKASSPTFPHHLSLCQDDRLEQNSPLGLFHEL